MKTTIQGAFGAIIITLFIGTLFSLSVNGQTKSRAGDEAIKQLRESGSYNSLRATFEAVRNSNNNELQRPAAGEVKLKAVDGEADDTFGAGVAVSGNTAIIGAALDNFGANLSQGSAYIFVRNGTAWTQQQKLVASDDAFGDAFGSGVDISGDKAIIAAEEDNVGTNADQGLAYVFVKSGGIWTQQQKLVASDGAARDYFGGSVAISGNTAIVGSLADDIGANMDQGSAYIFDLNSRPNFDFDGDGKADLSLFRPSNGYWYLNNSSVGFTYYGFGLDGDQIAPADYDGDGKADLGIFRPSSGTWYLQRSTQGFTAIQFGAAGDKPTPNAFVP